MKQTVKRRITALLLSAVTLGSLATTSITSVSAAVQPVQVASKSEQYVLKAVDLIAESNVLGPVGTAIIKIMSAVSKTQVKTEVSLADVSKQIVDLSTQMDGMKEELLNAIGTANDVSEFTSAFNDVNRNFYSNSTSTGSVERRFNEIVLSNNLTDTQKDKKLAMIVGEPGTWNQNDILKAIDKYQSYLMGIEKLTSDNSTINDIMLKKIPAKLAAENAFNGSSRICLGTEVLDEFKNVFFADSLAVYLHAISRIIVCLEAQARQLDGIDDFEAKKCRAQIEEYNKNIVNIFNVADKACIASVDPMAIYDFSSNNTSPTMFYLSRKSETRNYPNRSGSSYEEVKNIMNSNGTSESFVRNVITHVTKKYPGKSLRQFFTDLGVSVPGNCKYLAVGDAGYWSYPTGIDTTGRVNTFYAAELDSNNPSGSIPKLDYNGLRGCRTNCPTMFITKNTSDYPEQLKRMYEKADKILANDTDLYTESSLNNLKNARYTGAFAYYKTVLEEKKINVDGKEVVYCVQVVKKEYEFPKDDIPNQLKYRYNNERALAIYDAISNLEYTILKGDANGDGEITIEDVTAIQSFLSYQSEMTLRNQLNADTNSNGVVEINDATKIQCYLAGLKDTLD